MSTEAPYSYTTKSSAGDLFTVRGENFDDFVANLAKATGIGSIAQLHSALTGAPATLDEAVAIVQQTFPGSTVEAHNAPVQAYAAAPAPIQGFAPIAPPAQAAPAPAGGQTCQHGPMVLKPAGISQKTGKPYTAFWACQWPDRSQQCKAISA